MQPRFVSHLFVALTLLVFGIVGTTPAHAQSAPGIATTPANTTRPWQGSGMLTVTATGTESLTNQCEHENGVVRHSPGWQTD